MHKWKLRFLVLLGPQVRATLANSNPNKKNEIEDVAMESAASSLKFSDVSTDHSTRWPGVHIEYHACMLGRKCVKAWPLI